MYTYSILDLDTGIRWLRIEHTLVANIAYSDTVTFEVVFESSYDPWVDPANIMVEDSGWC